MGINNYSSITQKFNKEPMIKFNKSLKMFNHFLSTCVGHSKLIFTSCRRQRQLQARKKFQTFHLINKTTGITFIFLLPSTLFAAQSIKTNYYIGITQSIGNEKSALINEKINLTSITPKFNLEYTKSKVNLSLDYSLIASRDNIDNISSSSHHLKLSSLFTHIPSEWTTSFRSELLQKNKSDTGKLFSNSSFTSNNADDYIINSLKSTRNHQINKNTSINSSIQFSNQGFKNDSLSKSMGIFLGLNLSEVTPSINFSTTLNSTKNLNSNDYNHHLSLNSTYIINSRLNGLFSVSSNSSNNANFDETSYSLGVNWKISPSNLINFGIGKFGNTNTWSTNTIINVRRTSFHLSHSENITTLNQSIINNQSNNNSIFNNSTSDQLSFIKTTKLSLNHRLRRLTTSLSLVKSESHSDLQSSADKTNYIASILFNYQLKKNQSINYTFTKNSIKSLTNNQLNEHSVNWSSKSSRKSTYNISIKYFEQNNDNILFDSETSQIDFNYTYKFK